MSKDILDMYGSDTKQPQAGRASCGGCEEAKELPYDPPKGPTGQMQRSPGLHGSNHGNAGTQGKH